MRRAILGAMAVLSVVLAAPAAAHEPYVLPLAFAPTRDFVGVEFGMTEGNFFASDVAIRGEEPLVLVNPAGARAPITSTTNFRQFGAAEAAVPAPGTYRITTGQRTGRVNRQALVDGRWRSIRPAPQPGAQAPRPAPANQAPNPNGPIAEADVPPRARIVETTNVLIAETYVSRGAPTPAALAPVRQGFELRPITHPNEIYVDGGFAFELLNDGRPLSGVHFEAIRGGDHYTGRNVTIEGQTDRAGRARVQFTEPGVYVLIARYPARDPASSAPPPARSYLYSLTFEVTR